jgi:hypothetical protein
MKRLVLALCCVCSLWPALCAAGLALPPSVGAIPQPVLDAARARSRDALRPFEPGWENTAMMEAPEGHRITDGRSGETENDACQYARGTTMLVHIFINHTGIGGTWTLADRDDAAAQSLIAKEFYLENAPPEANLHFDHEGSGQYYYFIASVPYDIPYDGLTRGIMEDAVASLGGTDDDGDGWLFDDFSALLQKYSGGWDNVICTFEPANVYGRCWAEINGHSWTAIYYHGDANVRAHEWGHIFGACDEYVEDGHCAHGADCGPCAGSFLDDVIENENCQLPECPLDVDCVMIFNHFAICEPTLNYWAWVDENSDGVLDLVKRHIPPDTFVDIYEAQDGVVYYSNDVEDSYVIAQKNNTWSVVGVRSPAGSDYDIAMYGENNHQNLLATCAMNSPTVDFVVADYNHARLQNEHFQVTRWSGTDDPYRIQWESGISMLYPDGVVRGGTWQASNVVRVWEVPLFGGESITFTLDVTSGSPDLGMGLFRSNGSYYYVPRSSAQWLRDAGGAGESETFAYDVPADDVYGLVVWSNSYASGEYSIQIGPTPVTLSEETPYYSGFPLRLYNYTANATSWSFVGVRPNTGTSASLSLFGDSDYQTELAVSDNSAGIEFVAVDYTPGQSQDFVRVARQEGTGSHRTEWEQDSDFLIGATGVTWTSTHVGKIWDVGLADGQTYFLREYHSGGQDTGFYLYSSADGDHYKAKSDWSAASDSRPPEAGGEWFLYTAPATDRYGVCMVVNNEADGSSSLWFGPRILMDSDSRKTSEWEVVWGRAGGASADWAAFGVRPEAGEQASVWLYGDDAYTVTSLCSSDQSGSGVNFVVADLNHSPTGPYYPRFRRTSGNGPLDCEWEGGPDGFIFEPGAVNSSLQSWAALDVVDAFDLYVDGSGSGGQHVTIGVEDQSGVMDLGVAVFASFGATYYANPTDAVALADNAGVGETETVEFTANREDWYGLVIFNQTETGGPYKIIFSDQPAGAPEQEVPTELALQAVSGNPFMREALLRLSLPQQRDVELGIYDVAGRSIRTLSHERLRAGSYSISWDGCDDQGSPAPTGVYLVRLVAGDQERRLKLVRCQ